MLTVRNTSDADANTKKVSQTQAQYPDAKVSIRELNLAGLSAVHDFADNLAAEVANGNLPPIASIIRNAISSTMQKSPEKAMIRHSSFGSKGGRVVLLSSDAHWAGKKSLEKHRPVIPEDLQLLVNPAPQDPTDNFARGFQRYANSTLAIAMWMYALNRYSEKDPKLSNITAVAMNPGNLSDTRPLPMNTLRMLTYMSKLIIRPPKPLLRLMDPTMRTSAEAGVDVIELATDKAHPKRLRLFLLFLRTSVRLTV
ncbi:MAG: hypothetical protein Q9217_004169 [Psora testacea]